MMLLVISAILASLAMGVTIAYALCSALFLVFRLHVQGQPPAALRSGRAAPLDISPETR